MKSHAFTSGAAVGLACAFGALTNAPAQAETNNGTWPQAYSVNRDDAAGTLNLATPYYSIRHNLKKGGAIDRISLTHGRAPSLVLQPIAWLLRDARGTAFSDLNDAKPRVKLSREGLNEIVTVERALLDDQGHSSGAGLKTVYEYRWGYVKVHNELSVPETGIDISEIRAFQTVLDPALTDYGYREGVTEADGAPPFSFGSCKWGKLGSKAEGQRVKLNHLPRHFLFADPGVEGIEWFMSSDLAQWELQLTGKRGQGLCRVEPAEDPAGYAVSIAPFAGSNSSVRLTNACAFDYYIGLPILEGHALRPWFHSSFNRNRGDWVSADEIKGWAKKGIQTVHCHNDGDYYEDGLFWRDGSYPPYPDMTNYDKVIENCHRVGIRVATYFSNKELHPSTAEFQQHGSAWARKDAKGRMQHNFFKGTNEFGAQMCLHSGWLPFLESSIDRVLTHHKLDGVYYDWNVALLCCDSLHAKKGPGDAAAAGHWDMDELLQLMEWTRQRVGPNGIVIVHNTTTPMFATENFANYVVANEWGYGKWNGDGPALKDLPLEWSLAGARARGVISYGQLDANSPRRLHRVFALEALLGGSTPWPASPETFDLFSILEPLGNVETCQFKDWRNPAVTLEGKRCASAIYSRPGEWWVLLANLSAQPDELRVRIDRARLPGAPGSLRVAELVDPRAAQEPPVPLSVQQLLSDGARVAVQADSARLLRLR